MPSKVWLDTDIGSDVDDAVALTLALLSPEIELIGISTVYGDVSLRSRIGGHGRSSCVLGMRATATE